MEDISPTNEPRKSRKGVILLIVALPVIAAVVGYILYQMQRSPYTILVNGKPVASVESRYAARDVLTQARVMKADGAPTEAVRFADRVTVRKASKSAALSEIPEAVRAVQESASVEAELFAINVNGDPLVALKSKEDADRTLELVKQYYEKGLPNIVGESTFKGDVFIEKRFLGADKFRQTPEDACRTLTGIVIPAVTHTVVRGDRAVHLAKQYGLILPELKGLNPGVNMDALVEGTKLIIKRATKPLTVVTRSIITETVDVAPPAEAARYGSARTGKRTSRVMVTYENGRPVSKEVISQITTWDRPQNSYNEYGTYSHYSRRSNRRYHR